MSLSSGPNLGLLVNGAAGEAHYSELLRLWRGLDGLIQGRVINTTTATPPGSPADGDCYIVAASPTGAWAGQAGKIARYSSVTVGWEFYAPHAGWSMFDIASTLTYRYSGSAWVSLNRVNGPGSVTDSDFAQFNGTTGALLKGGLSLDTDSALTANSNVKVPSQAAVKGYVDGHLSSYVTTSALSTDIGTTIQAYDSDLVAIAALTPANDDIIQRKSGAWTNRTVAQHVVDLQGDGLTATLAGFRGIPINSQIINYTLVASDSGKCIYHPATDASARVWTIPANGSVAFPIGTAITFDNDFGAGVLTIQITTDTLVLVGTAGSTGTRTLASGGQATAVKVTATRWRISGTGLS